MQFPPEGIAHLSAGIIGLLSGVTALFTRKGSRVHRLAGRVFLAAMLTTAGTGAYMGFAKGQIDNAIAGIMTLYLLITGLLAVLRGEGKSGRIELAAFLCAVLAAVAAFYFAIQAVQNGRAMLGGVPYFVFASIITLAAILDLSVVVRGGVCGKQRIARHLWRMHLGFAAAVGSVFPGQLHRIMPELLKVKPFVVLFTPPFAVLGLMIFWLAIVLFTNWFRNPTRGPIRTVQDLPATAGGGKLG